MPKAVDTLPKTLRPFRSHGVDLQYQEGDDQATADCPFCGRDRKLSISVAEGTWRCFVCGTGSKRGGGNSYTFVRQLWEAAEGVASESDYAALAADRRLLEAGTLREWGVRKSPLTGDWLLPGYSPDGAMNNLYRYGVPGGRPGGKRTLLGTAEMNHQLFGVGAFDPARPETWLCEGPWDAMALREVLDRVKRTPDGRLVPTSTPAGSLGASVNVVGVPGCTTFAEAWAGSHLFAGKKVVLLYDNDHPKETPPGSGRFTRAGHDGCRRTAGLLAGAAPEGRPDSLHHLLWGAEGHDPALPSGYDVRDWLTRGGFDEGSGGWTTLPLATRASQLSDLLARVAPVPPEWTEAGAGGGKAAAGGAAKMDPLPCTDWKTLLTAWKKAMKLHDGLRGGLAVMLAVATSTDGIEDQCWVKVVSPPSTGKTSIAEAMAVADRWVYCKDTIKGMVSGFDDGSGQDHSLINVLGGKTFIIKDGDTLMKQENVEQIMSEIRAAFDTVIRTSYRNKASRDYAGKRISFLLCGTNSLVSVDRSELGERFLTYRIMGRIDEDLEDEVLARVVHRVHRNRAMESNCKAESRQSAEMTLAMRLTGGYVDHLRKNSRELLAGVDASDEVLRLITRYGKFAAFMRTRPSLTQDEVADREFATRIVSQMMTLANCLAVVLNKREVDAEVMDTMRKVAMDTGTGRMLEICRWLYHHRATGLDSKGLANACNKKHDDKLKMLRFAREIGVVEFFNEAVGPGVSGRTKWRLTERMLRLYEEVVHGVTD